MYCSGFELADECNQMNPRRRDCRGGLGGVVEVLSCERVGLGCCLLLGQLLIPSELWSVASKLGYGNVIGGDWRRSPNQLP